MSILGNRVVRREDEKFLTVFDAVPEKRGFLSPTEFRRTFEDDVPTARYLGIHNFTRGFVERVRLGDLQGMTFEGIVAKSGERHKILRAKAKTQKWIDRVIAIHGEAAAQKIIES